MSNDYELLQAICRQDFCSFSQKGFEILEPGNPLEFNWHIECIAEHLQALFDGEIKDLIINIPPRFLKSVQTAQIFPAWCLGRRPHMEIICASYAHSLAERNVTKCRQIVQSDFYRDLFPQTEISADMNTKDYFTTTQNGQYKGTGIGGSITGFGANLLIVDDPLNPKEGVSDTIRMTAIDEIRSTLFSRFNKFSERKFVMIMQRLHDADPTGDLLKDGGYYHLKLPAYADRRIQIDLRGHQWTMEPGDYLSPRLGPEEIDKLRVNLGEYHFVGQYLQEPVPLGGGEFRPEWIQRYAPGAIKPKEMNVAILCDPSGGEEMNKRKKKLSDWSAFLVVGLGTDNNYYLLDAIRDRFNPTERIDTLFMLHRKWNALCGKPPKVGYEKYGMMSDTHYINEKKKTDAYNFPLVELGGSTMKEERIRRLIPDMQNGRWYFPATMIYVDNEGRQFDLVKEIIDGEMKSFPRARYDDCIDALSRIYDTDLFMVFPKPKQGMVEKSIAMNRQSAASQSWEDF